jgi:serine O-acetyltransferase
MTRPPPSFLERLRAARAAHTLPPGVSALAREFVDAVLALLFPHFAPARRADPVQVCDDHARAHERLVALLSAHASAAPRAEALADAFFERVPALYEAMLEDAAATYQADPAARTLDEVIATYPGFLALACYRMAHQLHGQGVDLLPRVITELAHRDTGIDIHPGARIGRALSIDHGTGIVIGETTMIGDRVRLYQGVTLGALSVSKDAAHSKRHPTLEEDVIVYANATILGGETVVGAGSVIGGNVWLTHSVPPGSVVTEAASTETRIVAGRTADD